MNTINWDGDETIDDLYDHWVQLAEEGNRAGLLKELSRAVNSGRRAYRQTEDGDLEYVGPAYSTQEMTILELSYGDDADKVIEMVRESDEHELGENLK